MNPVNIYISNYNGQPVAIKKISTNESNQSLDEERAAIRASLDKQLAAIRDSKLKPTPEPEPQPSREILKNKLMESIDQYKRMLTNYGECLIEATANSSQNLFSRSIPMKMILFNRFFDIYYEIYTKTSNHQMHGKLIETLANSNRDKNMTSFAGFINELLIPNLDPIKQKEYYNFTKALVKALLSTSTDLWNKNSDEVLHKSSTSNKVDLARAAVFNFAVLGHLMKVFLGVSSFTKHDEKFKNLSPQTQPEAYKQAHFQIFSIGNLSSQRKMDLALFFKKMVIDCVAKVNDFNYFSRNIINCNLFRDHIDLLTFKVRDIYNTSKTNCDFSVVVNNREIYDEIIVQFEEVCKWLLDKTLVIQNKFSILKDFLLYLKLGNLDKIANLPVYHSTVQFESLVIDEIKTFQKQLDANRVKKILSAIDECPWIKELRAMNTAHEQVFSGIAQISQYALSDVIEICRQCHGNLPSRAASPARTISVSSKNDDFEPSTIESDPDEKSAQETESFDYASTTTAEQKITSSKQVNTKEYSLVTAVQCLEGNFANQLSSLLQANNSMGFQDAIKNSSDHLDDLLTEIRRFERILKGTIYKDDFFCTLINFVNHGTLLTEQLLTALLCKTKSYKTENDLKAAFTHQLPLLLSGCRFGNFHISQTTRNTIYFTNCGEILSRNLSTLIENAPSTSNSSIEGLLAAAYSWMLSQDNQKPDQLIHASIEYLAKILNACNELCMLIKTNDKSQRKILLAEKEQIAIMVSHLQKSLLDTANKMQIIPQNQLKNQFSDQLNEIDQHITGFLNHPPLPLLIRKGFENLQNNYLRRLKTELQYHDHLPYKELRLHYCNVLMLNQFIAEEFCTLLVQFKKIHVDMNEIDHNLVKLVQLLGFELKHFSKEGQNFLKSGKDVRALTRYRFSFGKKGHVQKNLDSVSEIAQDKQLAESGNDGFQLVESTKKGGIKGMLENVRSNIDILSKLIQKLTSNVKKNSEF